MTEGLALSQVTLYDIETSIYTQLNNIVFMLNWMELRRENLLKCTGALWRWDSIRRDGSFKRS